MGGTLGRQEVVGQGRRQGPGVAGLVAAAC